MKLRIINNVVLAVIIAINAYIILLPFVPAVAFWWQSRQPQAQAALDQKVQATTRQTVQSPAANGENRIIIPSILVDQPFLEGKNTATLNKGLWLRPHSSPPDRLGNTVIAGHRFAYANIPGTFYNLDKVKVGDQVALFWRGHSYLYRVREISVVAPTKTEVEGPTPNAQLTLYTCTPLWHPTQRLVVVANLESHI